VPKSVEEEPNSGNSTDVNNERRPHLLSFQTNEAVVMSDPTQAIEDNLPPLGL